MNPKKFRDIVNPERAAGIEAVFGHATYTIGNNGSTVNLIESLEDILSPQRNDT